MLPLPSSTRSPLRVAPVRWETTASYIARLAAQHQLTTAQLLSSLGIPRPGHNIQPREVRSPYDTLELYFNAAGREAICHFSGVPDEHLRHALPLWQPRRAERRCDTSSRARLRFSGVPAVVGCPHCTVVRTGHGQRVRQYLPATALICRNHSMAMLGPHTLNLRPVSVEHVGLSGTPEILAAHRDHLRLLRRYRDRGQQAVDQAARLTESWRRHRHREETIWPGRARRIGGGRQPGLWFTLAREVITYPETIAVARILSDPSFGRPSPSRAGMIRSAIAESLARPYLADPAFYPERLLSRLPADPHRFARHRPLGWLYRWNVSDQCSIELTELGYRRLPATRSKRGKAGPKTSRSGRYA